MRTFPKAPRKAILRDWHGGKLCPHVLEMLSKNAKVKRKHFVDEHQSCSYLNYVQDAPIIKLWGPFLMILWTCQFS